MIRGVTPARRRGRSSDGRSSGRSTAIGGPGVGGLPSPHVDVAAASTAQWGCAHRWKTATSWPGQDDAVRVRDLTCRRCGLKVKTEERLTVPWDEGDLVAQVKALLPEGQAMPLWDKGMTE
jgi:hypothetical protein